MSTIDEAVEGAKGVPKLLKEKNGWKTAMLLLAVGGLLVYGWFLYQTNAKKNALTWKLAHWEMTVIEKHWNESPPPDFWDQP